MNIKKMVIYMMALGIILCGINIYMAEAQTVRLNRNASCVFGFTELSKGDFEKSTGIKLEVNEGCSGISNGINAVLQGKADVGTASRPLTSSEKRKGLHETLVGKDALVISVNKNNPVDNLTMAQLSDIFLGKIENWSDLGGQDSNIIIINPICGEHPQGIIDTVLRKGKKAAGSFADRVIKVEITDTAFERLAKFKSALSLTTKMFFTDKTKVLKLDGVSPTRQNVKNETYPLLRPLYLVTKGAPSGAVKKYIDYILSGSGQKYVEKGLGLDWLEEGF